MGQTNRAIAEGNYFRNIFAFSDKMYSRRVWLEEAEEVLAKPRAQLFPLGARQGPANEYPAPTVLLQIRLQPVDQILLVAFGLQPAGQTLLLQLGQLHKTRIH